MANSCTAWRTTLAAQTPVYDKVFLEDYKPMVSPFIGKHQTAVWESGSGDTHYFDKMTVGQPNLQDRWQKLDASECGSNPCSPPRTFIGMGSVRNSYYPEQKDLLSQTFCLTQLEHSTRPSEQLQEWLKLVKQIPEMYTEDFIRVHAFDFNSTVQIAGLNSGALKTFTPNRSTNLTGQLTTINLGGTANLPTSKLTWPYLRRLTTALMLEGYHNAPSGLPAGMYNLVTSPDDWFGLTNGNESLRNLLALKSLEDASPLFKVGVGPTADPFGQIVPSLDTRQMRFQHIGNGVLNRVEPYVNVAGTTGIQRSVNSAYLNATYALSYLWHPMAIKVFTRDFKKLNELVPSVNSALYGEWMFINDNPLMAIQPDGTVCTLNNPDRSQFYWLTKLYLGFQYMYPELLMPILHQTDASGLCAIVDDPVCCAAPQYVPQNYSDNPAVCEA